MKFIKVSIINSMFRRKINPNDRIKILGFLKRISEEINNASKIIKDANFITDQVLGAVKSMKTEEFEKQYIALAGQLSKIFDKTDEINAFWPQMADNRGMHIMTDLKLQLSEMLVCAIDDLTLNLYRIESSWGRISDPPSPKALKQAKDDLAHASSNLIKALFKFARYYQISKAEWESLSQSTLV